MNTSLKINEDIRALLRCLSSLCLLNLEKYLKRKDAISNKNDILMDRLLHECDRGERRKIIKACILYLAKMSEIYELERDWFNFERYNDEILMLWESLNIEERGSFIYKLENALRHRVMAIWRRHRISKVNYPLSKSSGDVAIWLLIYYPNFAEEIKQLLAYLKLIVPLVAKSLEQDIIKKSKNYPTFDIVLIIPQGHN